MVNLNNSLFYFDWNILAMANIKFFLGPNYNLLNLRGGVDGETPPWVTNKEFCHLFQNLLEHDQIFKKGVLFMLNVG